VGLREKLLLRPDLEYGDEPQYFQLERRRIALLLLISMFVSRILAVLRRIFLSLLLFLMGTETSVHAAPWQFIVFSDTQAPDWTNQLNNVIMGELAQAITNERPAFVLFGGDMVNSPLKGTTEAWMEMMAPVYDAGIPVFPAIGNHDADAVFEINRLLGPGLPDNGPEGEIDQTYFVTHENSLVLVLNSFSYTNRLKVNQRWVDAVLATNTQTHVFAISHAPAFRVLHTDCLAAYPRERNDFWASLRRANCRMYFAGHDHFYDHARIDDQDGDPDDDIHQYILGTGGAAFYNDAPYHGDNGPYNPLRVLHEQQYGYLRVEVDGLRVSATWCRRTAPGVFTASSEVFSYSARPALRLGNSDAGFALTWASPSVLQASPELSGPFTNVVGATSPFALTNLSEPRLFYRLTGP
jgi:hypothetical protein